MIDAFWCKYEFLMPQNVKYSTCASVAQFLILPYRTVISRKTILRITGREQNHTQKISRMIFPFSYHIYIWKVHFYLFCIFFSRFCLTPSDSVYEIEMKRIAFIIHYYTKCCFPLHVREKLIDFEILRIGTHFYEP